jgi:hypothetical protein
MWAVASAAEVLHDSAVGFVKNMHDMEDSWVELYEAHISVGHRVPRSVSGG